MVLEHPEFIIRVALSMEISIIELLSRSPWLDLYVEYVIRTNAYRRRVFDVVGYTASAVRLYEEFSGADRIKCVQSPSYVWPLPYM